MTGKTSVTAGQGISISNKPWTQVMNILDKAYFHLLQALDSGYEYLR